MNSPYQCVASAKLAGLSSTLRRVLILRVIVVREVLQVALHVREHVRRLLHVEVLPVVGVQSVTRREFLLRLEYQLRETALVVDFDHAHAEARCDGVMRVQCDEAPVDGRRVVVAALRQIELGEVAIHAVFVTAMTVRREVLVDHLGSAEVRETQAHHLQRIVDPLRLFLFVLRVEVVAGRDFVVEQREVLVQRLFVELLLVQRPAELVERQFVERRRAAHRDHGFVGRFCVRVLAPHEEVLAAAEIHFVDVFRLRVLGDQPVDDVLRVVGRAELVVSARHLVQHLVVALVPRVVVEDLLVRLDRLQRPAQIDVGAFRQLRLIEVVGAAMETARSRALRKRQYSRWLPCRQRFPRWSFPRGRSPELDRPVCVP